MTTRDGTDAPLGSTTAFLDSRPSLEPAPEVDLALDAPALPSPPRVVAVDLREGLGELYEAVVELCTEEPALDLDALLGERVVLRLERGPRTRRVCGIVRRVERMDSWGDRRRGRVWVVPALWALSQRSDCRVFQDMTAVEVVAAVLRGAGRTDLSPAIELRREYPKREYCVQYRERDLDFVMRLLEEEGITLYFRHDGEAETVVLTDAPTWALVPTINRKPVPLSPPQSELAPVEVVRRLAMSRELRPTSATLRDYDFTRPGAEVDMTRARPRGESGARALYDYPGDYTLGEYDPGGRSYTAHDGARRAELRHLEAVLDERCVSGEGNVTGFTPGRVFELVGHEHGDLDQRYLIVHVEHRARAPEALDAEPRAAGPAIGEDRYRNTFRCVPASATWVPPRRSPRPSLHATQTATVTGPAGEEVYVDPHGRIKVQFHWDRLGVRDERSTCWIRVAQAWAGAGWGTLFIPRVGMEVVVSFLEGNPDRPLVIGCVYNGQNLPPYALPSEKTRSTLRTNSTPGGGGYNELRFEDLKGAEEVFFHAQRDHNEVIERDHTEAVRGDQTVSVGGDQRVHVRGVQAVVVDGEGGSAGRHATLHVQGDLTTDATNEIRVTAPAKITLTCDGTTVTLTPGAIHLDTGRGAKIFMDEDRIHVEGREVLFKSGERMDVAGGSLLDMKASRINLNC